MSPKKTAERPNVPFQLDTDKDGHWVIFGENLKLHRATPQEVALWKVYHEKNLKELNLQRQLEQANKLVEGLQVTVALLDEKLGRR